MQNLEELAHSLNNTVTDEGTSFEAIVTDNGLIDVTCSNNKEFPILIAMTDSQILAVTSLFNVSEVKEDKIDELNGMLLTISPVVPLSSTGLQDGNYILFGAMSLNTIIDNIVHELEVQAENTIDVLEAVSPLLN
ncbi:MAG: DUF2170 family protein [Proteobacteria bacterium]|nr:DUF2170 family protein [Pseudomonadota bacterium]